MRDAHPRRQVSIVDRIDCRRQHLGRHIDAAAACARIALRRENEIAAGAAADLQHVVAGPELQAIDQAVAAEQVEFACRVVEVALMLVDAVHPRRSGGIAHRSAAKHVQMEATIDRRAVALRPRQRFAQRDNPSATGSHRQRGPAAGSARRRCGRSRVRPAGPCG